MMKINKKQIIVLAIAIIAVVTVSGCTSGIVALPNILLKIAEWLQIIAAGLAALAGAAARSATVDGANIASTMSFSATDMSANAELFASECGDLPTGDYVRQTIEKEGRRAAYWLDSEGKIMCVATSSAEYADKFEATATKTKTMSARAPTESVSIQDVELLNDLSAALRKLSTNINSAGLSSEQVSVLQSQDVRVRAEYVDTKIKATFESAGNTVILWFDKETKDVIKIKAGTDE